MMDIKKFYEDLSVCVVGGAGMIGSSLVKQLVDVGAYVTVLDDFSRGKFIHPLASYVNGSAANESTCNYAFRNVAVRGPVVDVVFNLAAKVAGVLYNTSNHLDMFHANINLLTVPTIVADKLQVPHYLQTSSVCVYDPDRNHPSIEEEGLMGEPHHSNRGYALAKRMGEYMVLDSNLPHAVIVRPANSYGPRDYFDEYAHVIPALINKAKSGKIYAYGHADIVREFVYADDVARGMLHAVMNGENKAAYNLGTDKCPECTTTLGRLVSMVQNEFGTDAPVEFSGTVGGDELRWSSCQLAREELDWEHEVHLGDGLAKMHNWMKGNERLPSDRNNQ